MIIFLLTVLLVQTDPVLDRIEDRYDESKSLYLEFKQTVSDGFELNTQQTCKLWFVKPNKFRYETDDQLLVTDTKTIWDFRSQTNQVRINDYNPKNYRVRPSDFLLNYKERFTAINLGEENGSLKIRLVPKKQLSSSSNFDVRSETMMIWVNPKRYEIEKVRVEKANGNVIVYDIQRTYFNRSFENQTFTFTNSTNAEEVDLRF